MYDVLVIGNGGREHALALKLRQSKKVGRIFIAPGNAGTKQLGANLPELKPDNIEGLIKFARDEHIHLAIVGPEAPLCAGIVDKFEQAGLKIFGPNKIASRLEGSKAIAKQIMKELNIPTAPFATYSMHPEALRHVKMHFIEHPNAPIVVKADGLCGGKGVYICSTLTEAVSALNELMINKKFKEAGAMIVIEDFLEGEELSVLAMCDGKNLVLLKPSQDHKQVGEGDTGPNTGGMGAFAPVPWVTHEMLVEIRQTIFIPLLDGLRRKTGIEYKGCLYAGLIYTTNGFKVLEWNVRFGDPETQIILPLINSNETDFMELVLACANGRLNEIEVKWQTKYAVCIVLCAEPYPKTPDTGHQITGLEKAEAIKGITIIHAGTAIKDGVLVTSGGRVVNVICVAETLKAAQQDANKAAELIKFKGKFYRRDIGKRPAPAFMQ